MKGKPLLLSGLISIKQWVKGHFYRVPLVWQFMEFAQGLKYALDYVYYTRWPGKEHRSSLREINIEFASACNLRCRFCALDHTKPREFIPEETLRSFFDELLANPRFHSVEVLNLYNGGEVLLHPERVERLALIKEYKEKARLGGIPFPRVNLLTNGMLLRPPLARQILDLDVVDELGFSLDGGTPERFEAIRINAKWDTVQENIRFVHQYRKDQDLRLKLYSISCIEEPFPLRTDWMEESFQAVLQLMDKRELRRLHNWSGEIEGVRTRNKWHKIGCSMAMHQLVLLPGGNVSICCNDLNQKGVLGNLKTMSLSGIYDSAERHRYLEKLLKGRKRELELCRDCETY